MMRQLWCLTALLMLSFGALAQTPKQITFQGVIKNPNGSLPTESGLTATIRILAPNGCVLWQEQHTSVSITDGYINLVVGSGTPGGYQPAGQTFDKVFDNTTPQVGLTCLNADSSVNGSLTSYVPSAQDARKVRLETTLAQGAVLADFNLRSMPFAVAAQSANKIGSKSEADLLAVNSSAGLTQASLEAFIQSLTSVPGGSAKWDGSNFVSYDPTNGANLSSGSVPASAVASLPWSKLTSIPSPLSQIGGLSCVNGKILKMVSGSWACADDDTGGGGSVASVSGTLPIVVTGTTTPTVSVNAATTIATGVVQLATDGQSAANVVVQGNDSRLSNSRAPSGSAGGELSGTYPNPTIAKLAGVTLNVSSLTSGQILKYDGTNWVNSADAGLASETDPTVQSYAKNAPGTGLTVNGSNQIVPDFGTGAGKVVQGNDSRLSDGRTPSGSAGGDLGGSYPNPTVNQLRGQPVSATTPTVDQVLTYTSGAWTPTTFGIQNLRTSLGASQFSAGSCSASQTLNWSAITDAFSCVNINNLNGDKITAGTVAFARLPTGITASTIAAGNDSRFPSSTCGSGNKMRWDGSAWQCESDANSGGTISSLTTDVTASGTGAVAATVVQVGGVTAANIASGASLANAATNANTASTIVKRDGSGNFSAGTITANLTGNVSGTAANVTGTVALANGGTGQTTKTAAFDALSPNTNKGDIAVHNGTNNVRFPAGTDGYVLTADSSQTAGVKWAAAAAAGGGLTYQSVSTGTYSVTGTDDKKLLGVSVGSAISLPDTTGLSDGFMVVIGRLGTSPVSITPYGSQKISGLSSRTLVAQYDLINLIKIGTDWIVQAQVANDPCGVNPTPGVTCSGGVKYAGAYYSPATGFAKLMTTPGNCTDSATPTCNNAADALTKQFATANSTTGGVSADDGWANSVTQAAVGIDVAAKWCRNLNYGGYTDWYLPSQNELNVLYVNSAAITGFKSGGSYWSSTENSSNNANYVSFSDGSLNTSTKTTSYYVRCVRRY